MHGMPVTNSNFKYSDKKSLLSEELRLTTKRIMPYDNNAVKEININPAVACILPNEIKIPLVFVNSFCAPICRKKFKYAPFAVHFITSVFIIPKQPMNIKKLIKNKLYFFISIFSTLFHKNPINMQLSAAVAVNGGRYAPSGLMKCFIISARPAVIPPGTVPKTTEANLKNTPENEIRNA